MSKHRVNMFFFFRVATCIQYMFLFLRPAATATSNPDHLPWLVENDKTLVTIVKTEGGNTTKTLMSLAELMCSVTRDRGITEVKLIDHHISPMVKAIAFFQNI